MHWAHFQDLNFVLIFLKQNKIDKVKEVCVIVTVFESGMSTCSMTYKSWNKFICIVEIPCGNDIHFNKIQ